LALVLGGAQSIFVCGFDEPIGLPSEAAQRLSLQIQHILAYETGVASVADPLGGSYYVETVTNEIEKKATKLISKIEEMGGMVKAIEKKWVDTVLEDSNYSYIENLTNGQIAKVGVNIFRSASEKEHTVEPDRIPADVAKKRLEKLKDFRESRDREAVEHTLKVVYAKAKAKKENLIPYLIEAVKSYATVGEIFGTIQVAYGKPYDAFGQIGPPFVFLRQ
jgi:methylmalonyl-CoA mutase N-terminal domain/subunit